MAVDDWLLDDSSMRGCKMYEGEDLGHKVKAWTPAMAQRLGRRAQQGIGELYSIYCLRFPKYMWPNM